ncbi:unnamed protein product [Phytophthora fragariaefolia]|uniref:Unnamed protein product n=1 Tax=Phytophthora fragariaefolia TaxID=1490495 RepID=A0A9W6X1A6_9STRA|nr:unnamed protein product [Phytophthora fragariaefolia]
MEVPSLSKRSRSREPLAPHKNAYVHFSRGRREEVAAANPSWSVQQVSAELGRQWKGLTTEERKPWVELAQFDKARFHTEAHQHTSQQQPNEAHVAKELQQSAAANKTIYPRCKQQKLKMCPKPRQPDTAYICFWKSRRPEVVAANPFLAAPLVSKEVGRQWRALSDDERQVWEDMAAKDRLRFLDEVACLQPTLTATPGILKTPLKDPFSPKPAKTAFQLFMSHNRESFMLLNMSINEFRAEMSQLWKRLSDADKTEWHDLAKKDQRRYETEMNAYKPPAYMDSIVQRSRQRMKELRDMARGDAAAPRLPMNAYSCYLSTMRLELVQRRPNLKHSEIMREIGAMWRALSEDERAFYQHQADEDLERFRAEMENHLAQQNGAQTPNPPVHRRPRKGMQSDGQTDSQGGVEEYLQVKEPDIARKKRKLVAPRRPKTAYNLMYMSKRTELLATYQMSHNECSALCGRLWRQMSETERGPYKRMAEEDKRRYETEVQSYYSQQQDATMKTLRESAGFRHFLEAKRREDEGTSCDVALAIWQEMSEPHQLLWAELAHDNSQEGSVERTARKELNTLL